MKIDFEKINNSRLRRIISGTLDAIGTLERRGMSFQANIIRALIRSRISSLSENRIANRLYREELAKNKSARNSGFYDGVADVANHINALDTEGMSAAQVRSAIYQYCIDAQPK